MKTQVLTNTGLTQYDELIKEYIKEQGVGVTLDDVRGLINELDTNTTYTLTKNENNEIVLTGSDNSVMTISDNNIEIISETEPNNQTIGNFWVYEY